MDYEEFKIELNKLGFEIDQFHLPYIRKQHPMMLVGLRSNSNES